MPFRAAGSGERMMSIMSCIQCWQFIFPINYTVSERPSHLENVVIIAERCMSLGADPATHEPRIIIVKWYGYGRRFPFKLLLLFMMVGCYCRHLHALPIVKGFSFSSIRSLELTNRWEIICEIFLADQSWTNGWTMIIFQDIWITRCMNIICKFQRHFLYSSLAFTCYKGETVVLCWLSKTNACKESAKSG